MSARTLMIQGTASSVGKSVLTTALCRHFRQQGLRVAPFKSQNMALNAYVTPEGGEIGRAQAVQAEACGIEPTVDMNPILLKPEADSRSQVVLLGKSIGSFAAVDYHERKHELRQTIREALQRLRASYDLIVIEGAGSPAEINLKSRELVNMFVAEAADAPVLLVGDIDRGGVFASIVGTLELLEPHERARVAGFIINKFRGDLRLLDSGLEFLEQRTERPVLGVLPYIERLRIADEDSIAIADRRHRRRADASELEIAVVRLPRISNYDDVQPLEHEAGVIVRFVEHPSELRGADLVILPGTKSTVADLRWLCESGMGKAIVERAKRKEPVLGICGGCQMLGKAVIDAERLESDIPHADGLGLLSFTTRFSKEKHTAQVRARLASDCFLGTRSNASGVELRGYEIHGGRLLFESPRNATFSIHEQHREPCQRLDGEVSPNGLLVGTMMHGLFDNTSLRRDMLRVLRRRKQGEATGSIDDPTMRQTPEVWNPQDEYDRLAQFVRSHLDTDRLNAIVGL